VVRHNVIHDTLLGRPYPGIFVYGGGPGTNLVEDNVSWRAGEGIQVVSDAVVRNDDPGRMQKVKASIRGKTRPLVWSAHFHLPIPNQLKSWATSGYSRGLDAS
jgi:hypothetical protein